MKNFDIRRDPWICITPIGDPEVRELILSYTDRIGIDSEAWRRCGTSVGGYMSLYNGQMDGWDELNDSNIRLRNITLKELMIEVEKIIQDEEL